MPTTFVEPAQRLSVNQAPSDIDMSFEGDLPAPPQQAAEPAQAQIDPVADTYAFLDQVRARRAQAQPAATAPPAPPAPAQAPIPGRVAPGEMGFFERAMEAFQQRGEGLKHSVDIGRSIAFGNKDITDKWQKYEDYKGSVEDYAGKNWLLGAIGMLPDMTASFAGRAAGMGIGAGIAYTLNLIPIFAALPEELITVPLFAKIGGFIGGAAPMFFQGAGDLYSDMRADGINDETARDVSRVGAAPYAAVEMITELLPFGKLFPGAGAAGGKMTSELAKQIVKRTTQDTAFAFLKQAGLNTLGEASEEFLQELITETAKNVGAELSDVPGAHKSVGQIFERATMAFTQSLGPLAILGGLGAGVTTVTEGRGARSMLNEVDRRKTMLTTIGFDEAFIESSGIAERIAEMDTAEERKAALSKFVADNTDKLPTEFQKAYTPELVSQLDAQATDFQAQQRQNDQNELVNFQFAVEKTYGKLLSRDELGQPNQFESRETPDTNSARAAEHAARVFGAKSVMWYKNTDPSLIGATASVNGDTIFLDVDNPNPFMSSVMHETIHRMKESSPELYGELFAVASEEGTGFDAYKEKLLQRYRDQGLEPKNDDEWAWEELISEVVGSEGATPAFWETLYARSPQLVQRIVDIITEIVDSLQSARRTAPEIATFFNDFEKVRIAANDVLARHVQEISAAEGIAPETAVAEAPEIAPGAEAAVVQEQPPAVEPTAIAEEKATEPKQKHELAPSEADALKEWRQSVMARGGILMSKEQSVYSELAGEGKGEGIPPTARGKGGKGISYDVALAEAKEAGIDIGDGGPAALAGLLRGDIKQIQRAAEKAVAEPSRAQRAQEEANYVLQGIEEGGIPLEEALAMPRMPKGFKEEAKAADARRSKRDDPTTERMRKEQTYGHLWNERALESTALGVDAKEAIRKADIPVETVHKKEILDAVNAYIEDIGIYELEEQFINDKIDLSRVRKEARVAFEEGIGFKLMGMHNRLLVDAKTEADRTMHSTRATEVGIALNKVQQMGGVGTEYNKAWENAANTPSGAQSIWQKAADNANEGLLPQSAREIMDAAPAAMDKIAKELADLAMENKALKENNERLKIETFGYRETATKWAIVQKKKAALALQKMAKNENLRNDIIAEAKAVTQGQTCAEILARLRSAKTQVKLELSRIRLELKASHAAIIPLEPEEVLAFELRWRELLAEADEDGRTQAEIQFDQEVEAAGYGQFATLIRGAADESLNAEVTERTKPKSRSKRKKEAAEPSAKETLADAQLTLESWAQEHGLSDDEAAEAWAIITAQADAEFGRRDIFAWARNKGIDPEGLRQLDSTIKWRSLNAARIADLLLPKERVRLLSESQRRAIERSIIKRNGLVRHELGKLDIKVRNIVLASVSEREGIKRTLIDRINESLPELSTSDRTQLATLIAQALDEVVDREGQGMLNRAFADKLKRVDIKTSRAMNDMLTLLKVGALRTDSYFDLFAKQYGLKQINDEVRTELIRLSGIVDKAPKGIPRNMAVEALMAYVGKSVGYTKMEKFWAVWYSTMLSGHLTHMRNIVSTAFNTSSKILLLAATNPKDAASIFMSIPHGIRQGLIDFRAVAAEGASVLKETDKYTKLPTILASNPFGKSAVGKAFNSWKYVMNLMQAEDGLFRRIAIDAQAAMLASKMARDQGVPISQVWGKVSEQLFGIKEKRAEYEAQAQKEVDEGTIRAKDKTRRVYDLLEQNWPAEVRVPEGEMSPSAFGAWATFNYLPEGFLGVLSGKAKEIGKQFPPFRFIVPFTDIVANVANESLDWTPTGFVRAHRGMRGRDGKLHMPTPTEARIRYAESGIGTVAAISLYLLAKQYGDKDEDDPEKVFGLAGGGPSNKQDNFQLRETGWRPYTIKIGKDRYSYLYTPLAIPLSVMGHILDAEKYDKLEEKSLLTRAAFATLKSFAVIKDMSFLQGVSGIFEMINEDNPDQATKAAERYFGRLGATFVPIPKVIQQVASYFDPRIKDADNLLEFLMRDIPVASWGMRPKLNLLGEPARYQRGIVLSERRSDPVWNFIARNDAWLSKPRATKVAGVIMNDEELYNYIKISGQLIRKNIERDFDELNRLPKDQAKKALQRIQKAARASARWKIYQARQRA